MAQASIASVVKLILCQANTWKGSFKKFTHRKNQAFVPTKANFGIRVISPVDGFAPNAMASMGTVRIANP